MTRETTEKKLAGWIAGAVKTFGYTRLIEAGWEAGQVAAMTIDRVNYERFDVPGGGYVVVEWDNDGTVCVLS